MSDDDYWISAESLDAMDIQSSFVTVDSNRINTTFSQLFNVLKGLQRGMSSVNKQMSAQTERMSSIEKDNDQIKETSAKLKETCIRNEVNVGKVSDIANRNSGRLDALERRVKTMEQQGLELKGLADGLIKMKADICALQQDTDSLNGTIQKHGSDIKSIADGLSASNNLIEDERRRIGNLYKLFEMDEAKVVTAVSHLQQKKRGSSGDASSSPSSPNTASSPSTVVRSSACTYLLTLPSFAYLHESIAAGMADIRATMEQRLADFNRKVTDELALISQQVRNKVDMKVYAPFEKETRDTLAAHARQLVLIDKISAELSRKADKVSTEEAIVHLQKTKADRSDLQNMLTKDDIERLASQLRSLQKAFDALESKVNLELQSLKNLLKGGGGSVSGGGNEVDSSLAARVSRLERETAELYDIKADRFELLDLQRLLDDVRSPTANAVTNAVNQQQHRSRSHTPRAVTPETPGRRHGSLQPLQQQAVHRPSSASSASSVMQYTSSINPLSPSGVGKYRATAVLYDSDGRKTCASITAARAVGAVEHWNNIARHNSANPHEIPEGYKVHDV